MRCRYVAVLLSSFVAACGSARSAPSTPPVPIPDAVRARVAEVLGDDAARGTIDVEGPPDRRIYEASAKAHLEIEVDAAGALSATEVELPIASLPTAVAKVAAGYGRVREADLVIVPDGVTFDVEVEATTGGVREVTIDAAGAVVLDGDDDDDGDGDDEGADD